MTATEETEAIREDLIAIAKDTTFSELSTYLFPAWKDGCAQRCADLIDRTGETHEEIVLDDEQRVRDALEQQIEYASTPQIHAYHAYLTARLRADADEDERNHASVVARLDAEASR